MVKVCQVILEVSEARQVVQVLQDQAVAAVEPHVVACSVLWIEG